VSLFECRLLEVALAILISLDAPGRPRELWLELVFLAMSLEALCDVVSCSLKMFLFICPCILFGLGRNISRINGRNCNNCVIWRCEWRVRDLPVKSLAPSGLT
jgi:hypothetical protein